MIQIILENKQILEEDKIQGLKNHWNKYFEEKIIKYYENHEAYKEVIKNSIFQFEHIVTSTISFFQKEVNTKSLYWVCKQVFPKADIAQQSGYNYDAYMLRDHLYYFEDHISLFPVKNIEMYKTIEDFNREVLRVKYEQEKIQNQREIKKLKPGDRSYFKIYDSKKMVVVRPDSVKAACSYGAGTKWCIAATKSDNYMDSYSSRGTVFYFIIVKDTNEKFAISIINKGKLSRESFLDDEHVAIYNKEDNLIRYDELEKALGQEQSNELMSVVIPEIIQNYNNKTTNYRTNDRVVFYDPSISIEKTKEYFNKDNKIDVLDEMISQTIYLKSNNYPQIASPVGKELNNFVTKYFDLIIRTDNFSKSEFLANFCVYSQAFYDDFNKIKTASEIIKENGYSDIRRSYQIVSIVLQIAREGSSPNLKSDYSAKSIKRFFIRAFKLLKMVCTEQQFEYELNEISICFQRIKKSSLEKFNKLVGTDKIFRIKNAQNYYRAQKSSPGNLDRLIKKLDKHYQTSDLEFNGQAFGRFAKTTTNHRFKDYDGVIYNVVLDKKFLLNYIEQEYDIVKENKKSLKIVLESQKKITTKIDEYLNALKYEMRSFDDEQVVEILNHKIMDCKNNIRHPRPNSQFKLDEYEELFDKLIELRKDFSD